MTERLPAQPRAAQRLAVRGDLLTFSDDPENTERLGQDQRSESVQFTPGGWLLIEDGLVIGIEPAGFSVDQSWQIADHAGQLICPGFIDTHVHSAQLDVIASYGTTLLQWLERYTFPNERRFAQLEFARAEAQAFCQALLANGTTTAAVFPTVHGQSVDSLFAAASERGMSLIAGKVLMNRNAPQDLLDAADHGESEARRLIHRWHEHGRLHYAVTPRFAPTSTDEQLAMAGRLAQETTTLFVQTHVAENPEEDAWVARLFEHDRSYLSVYHRHGLLRERSLLGHGIWLDQPDRQLLADTGASVAFCPSSNLFLGSGLLDVQATEAHGASVVLASDVGGGTHLSMLRVMADASRVMSLTGQKLTAFRAFYLATLGAARALRLDHQIGSFRHGAYADLVVLNWANDALARRRDSRANHLHERLFALMMLGDQHNVTDTYIAGRRQCDLS